MTPLSLRTCANEEPNRLSSHSMQGACKVRGSVTSNEVALMLSQIKMRGEGDGILIGRGCLNAASSYS